MTATPPPTAPAPEAPARRGRAATAALYLAIGALVAAAALGAFFIIAGDQANVAGRAWLTLLLVALFAGAVVLDANVGNGPNRWYLGVSTIVNVVLVAVGLLKLWNGWLQPEDTAAASVWLAQMSRLLAIIVLFRAGLLFMQLYGLYFVTRGRTLVGRIMAMVTIALGWVTVLVLAIPAAFPETEWPEWWWRVAGATSLVAVVTTVIPLLLRAFDPNKPKPAPVQQPQPVAYAPVQQAPGYYAQQPVQQPYPAQYPQQPVHPGVPQPGSQPAPPVPPAAPAAPAGPAGPQPGSQPPPPAPAPQAAPPVQQPPVPPGAPTPPQ